MPALRLALSEIEETVSEWDVIVHPDGRVHDINDGSRRFLQLVDAMASPYDQSLPKKFKTVLSTAVVKFVCAYGGRFVELDDSGRYSLMDKVTARTKTSQALREMKPTKWTFVEGIQLWKVANTTPTEQMPETRQAPIYIDGQPGKWDVIGGQGGGSNHHEGNRRFRGLIEEFKVPYCFGSEGLLDGKAMKVEPMRQNLVYAIVNYVKFNGGRFINIDNHQDGTVRTSNVSDPHAVTQKVLIHGLSTTRHTTDSH